MQNLTVKFETIEPGYEVKIETMQILENIRLEIYDGTDAILYLGKSEVEFDWNEQAAELFANIDTCEPCSHVYSFNQTGGAIRFTCAKCGHSELIR